MQLSAQDMMAHGFLSPCIKNPPILRKKKIKKKKSEMM